MDFDSLTRAQRRTLGLIAINQDGGHHPKVLKALMDKGLIVESTVTLPGRFPVKIKRYGMDIGAHIAWCEWCARHARGE